MIQTTNKDFGKLTDILRQANLSLFGVDNTTEMTVPAQVIAAAMVPFPHGDTYEAKDLLEQRSKLLQEFGLQAPKTSDTDQAERFFQAVDPITQQRLTALKDDWASWDMNIEDNPREPTLGLEGTSDRDKFAANINHSLRASIIEKAMGGLTAVLHKPSMSA